MQRRQWVMRHNPVLTRIMTDSPLTVGNGSFAYTFDISGMQSLYPDYLDKVPLCTMADWGWHSFPAPTENGIFTLSDVRMRHFSRCGRTISCADTRFEETAQIYDWLRQNPHKVNLVRIGLRINGEQLKAGDFSGIHQTLDLYSGIAYSEYLLKGTPCRVTTACDPEKDILAFSVQSELLENGLSVDLDFPYASAGITGSDWDQPDRHSTVLEGWTIFRRADGMYWSMRADAPDAAMSRVSEHRIRIITDRQVLRLRLSFSRSTPPVPPVPEDTLDRCRIWWNRFWERGGMLDLSASSDPRAFELERRIVQSQHLLAVNCAGRMPPAETGLTCNSWYGKAHLEMHLWHMAWAPLWGHSELLERSLSWYHAHLPEATANASRNGYRGARWPKMTGDSAQDSPSPIAVHLIWQQPHILTMLDLIRRSLFLKDPDTLQVFLRMHWPLVRETAEFMADYAVKGTDGLYHLEPPLIPVQEHFAPESTRDPAFEVMYWAFGLGIAIRWAEAAGISPPDRWKEVCCRMAVPAEKDGLYIAHSAAPDTFMHHLSDHPSMLQCFGVLPGKGLDASSVKRTLNTVLEKWDLQSLWGWDYAVLAMTALRLGDPDLAAGLLLRNDEKNSYTACGHNRQGSRKDLPLYLPGNGGLLIACAMMSAGWDGCKEKKPGFSTASGWNAYWEGIMPWY